jgi:hypothetical protein
MGAGPLAIFCAVVWSHLAIDTAFQVKEGQIPGVNLGTVDGKEVQEAFDYVSNLTAENGLPDKMVIVHQLPEKVLINELLMTPKDVLELDPLRLLLTINKKPRGLSPWLLHK